MSITNNNVLTFSHTEILNNLDAIEKKTDELLPNSHLQNKLDDLAAQIKNEFSPLIEFNAWLEETSQEEEFYVNLSYYLVKLPMRSARNIITSLYSVISTALYMGVHPLKGSQYLTRSIYNLLHELSKPETWPKMGAGSIGFLAGQSMMLGNPVSLMGFALGGALIASGVSYRSIMNVVHSEKGKEIETLKDSVKQELKNLPDQMMVGLFTGLLFGGVERAFTSTEKPMPTPPKQPRPIHPDGEMHILSVNQFQVKEGVAQYQGASWDNLVKKVSDVSLEEAKAIANSDANIDFFFYVDGSEFRLTQGKFSYQDAVFFSGEPWWGSAPGSIGYVKA